MIFSLEMLRARKGDCLLLHFGPEDAPGLILIDGGPDKVYVPHLKPRLAAIRKARGLEKERPLDVDLLMVSHVDDDHIQGLLELTNEMVEARNAQQPLPLQVLDFWHNSFDKIIGNKPAELTAAMSGQFGPASVSGSLPTGATLDDDEAEWPGERPEEEMIVDTLKVLAGIEQGFRLRLNGEKLDFPRNSPFDGELVMAREEAEPVEVGQGLTLTVVGPMKPELDRLHAKHEAWLKRLKEQGKSPPAALAAYVDESVANLSSIVALAEFDDKRMLLTGDARGDKILEGLEKAGLLKPAGSGPMKVDILKVPHHGSSRNLRTDFFERITADHYVFSGDGEHGNPERAAFEMLLVARGRAPFTIHLTYPVADIDAEREKDWNKEQKSERDRLAKAATEEKKRKIKVRENWSHAEHGLGALFKARLAPDQTVKVVFAGKPHLIDLLDKVRF